VLGVVALLALVALALIPVVIAQSSRRPPPDLQLAARAQADGRYDDALALVSKLDQSDPDVAAVAGAARIARGRYKEAEDLLRPIALKAPTSAAALELGLLLKMLGHDDARPTLERVASAAARTNDPRVLARAGRALSALGAAHDANAAFRDAARAAPNDVDIQTAWGELWLATYDRREALKSFQIALKADPKWVPAMLGAARALSDDNPPQAAKLAQQVLEIAPTNVDAQLFLASGVVDDGGKRDEARAMVGKVLEINPSNIDALSLLTAIAYVDDKLPEFEATAAKALAIAPRSGEVFRVAAEHTAHAYRFDEAVVLARRSLTIEPDNARTLADLGTHLLRTGDEPEARRALEASFKKDAFNVVTYNLLNMMDTLDKFVTVKDGDVVLRMDPAEAPVMQDYVMSLAKRALSTLSKRYNFQVQGPILIEMFPKHDDFAVRNVGLPGMVYALGACFGRVVTIDSPRARPPGDFQWEATLWHELGHVISLQMSKHRLPRWASEGISTYEEKLAHAEWRRNQDMEFAGTLNRGEAPKLKDLNAAIMDPRTTSIAYYHAALFIEHVVELFGDAGLQRLLQAWGEGIDTEAALRKALDTDFDTLQVSFDKWIEGMFKDLRAALELPKDVDLRNAKLDDLRGLAEKFPGSYAVQLRLAAALREADDTDGTVQALERAHRLVPIATGDESPIAQIAQIALERKDTAAAIKALETQLAVDFDNVQAARRLAGLLRETSVTDPKRLEPVYRRIASIDPFDAEAHSHLGRFALERNDAETAVREFRAVLALGPVDRAAAHADLAESYLKSGQRAEARKQTLAALEIAPSYERAQNLLLELAGTRP
jgi:tetratricopeptide (TPR) repeat protein